MRINFETVAYRAITFLSVFAGIVIANEGIKKSFRKRM
jgi:hypothetical protein